MIEFSFGIYFWNLVSWLCGPCLETQLSKVAASPAPVRVPQIRIGATFVKSKVDERQSFNDQSIVSLTMMRPSSRQPCNGYDVGSWQVAPQHPRLNS